MTETDVNRDLGLGTRVAQKSHKRFLNRDGSFNVRRTGLPFFRSLSPYHALLTMSWTKFFLLISGAYFVINILFAFGYYLCGPGALYGLEGYTFEHAFYEEFFFSVQTLATIGYGRMSPHSMGANVLVTFEALVGLLGFALATGLLFARFSRPIAKIIYSKPAVIAPYQGITAFEFRIANERSNQLIQVQATVVLSRLETKNGITFREFHTLQLERDQVMFLPLHLVIVHPIGKKSPLYGVTDEEFNKSDAEFLILLTGVDETFSQTVHSRSSYKHHEVVWGARFKDMFLHGDDDMLGIDMRLIDEIEKAELPKP